jgi:hypothetical protein
VNIVFFEEAARRTVTLEGKPSEFRQLVDEMQRWTPTGGWSHEAQELVDALLGDE